MSNKLKSALSSAWTVIYHWVASVAVLGLIDWLSNPKLVSQLSPVFIKFGLPTALINVAIAFVKKYLTTEETQLS